MEERKIWGIHSEDAMTLLNKSIIAIGWKELGDLSKYSQDKEVFKAQYEKVFPNQKKQGIANSVGMLNRFVYEVKIDDIVVFPSKVNREINIGIVTGEYEYSEKEPIYPNIRKVKWLKHLPRTAFSQGLLHELGSLLSFFTVKNYPEEIIQALENKSKKAEVAKDDEVTVSESANDVMESTKDFILKALSRELKGYSFEGFVADLLTAMGYRTTISKQGGDHGIDITAYKDELPPRILVQVKSIDNKITESTIQSLKGAMREGDYGLFVTLSTYTDNAKKYLQYNPVIRGIDGSDLAELILKYYDKLSEKYQRIIPLKKVYIPISSEEL